MEISNRQLLAELFDRIQVGDLSPELGRGEGPWGPITYVFLKDPFYDFEILLTQIPSGTEPTWKEAQAILVDEAQEYETLEGVHEIPLTTNVIQVPYCVTRKRGEPMEIEFQPERYRARTKEDVDGEAVPPAYIHPGHWQEELSESY